MTPDSRPKLRENIQFFLAEDERVPFVFVRDPDGYVQEIERLHRSTLALLQNCDGKTAISEMAPELPIDQLLGFFSQLEESFFFEGDRLERARAEREEWIAETIRPAAHAGSGYPAERSEAHAFLDGHLSLAGQSGGTLTRLIAPHIDLRLGAEIHGYAHARLRASGRPDLVVVLGVCHSATEHPFIACRKDFATPCGTLRHDAEFLDELEEHYGQSLAEGVLVHETEHSVEFQALWIAHHWPDDPPPIVPILVRGFAEQIRAAESPRGLGHVERFLGALRATLQGKNAVVIASVDLAHVGPVYETDAIEATTLTAADQPLLDAMVANDAEAFFEAIAADGNANQVCGTAPIYLTLRLGDQPGELLKYGQGLIHPESGSVVSYAAVAFK
ncbi:MAG: AmmeMemoRadiSam system protein B [Planctomycetota bacterium]